MGELCCTSERSITGSFMKCKAKKNETELLDILWSPLLTRAPDTLFDAPKVISPHNTILENQRVTVFYRWRLQYSTS